MILHPPGDNRSASVLPIDREKDLHSLIVDLCSQLEREYESNDKYKKALQDIAFCNVPGFEDGSTVSASALGAFAMKRAREALD